MAPAVEAGAGAGAVASEADPPWPPESPDPPWPPESPDPPWPPECHTLGGESKERGDTENFCKQGFNNTRKTFNTGHQTRGKPRLKNTGE